MRTLKMTVSYVGDRFCGWQIQPNGVSIQSTFADAIFQVTGEKVVPVASGRTDSGVHALGQVVAISTASKLTNYTLQRALNAVLPNEIRVLSVEDAPISFDAVRHAKSKLYRYIVDNGEIANPFTQLRTWRYFRQLDAVLMDEAARTLEGTHDFRCFETDWPNRASSVRTVYRCRANRLGDYIWIDVEANGFLYNMVRAIVGTLVQVGEGKRKVAGVAELLREQCRATAGPTAPADGLYLVRVDYENSEQFAGTDNFRVQNSDIELDPTVGEKDRLDS